METSAMCKMGYDVTPYGPKSGHHSKSADMKIDKSVPRP